jgi:hypothetical protein
MQQNTWKKMDINEKSIFKTCTSEAFSMAEPMVSATNFLIRSFSSQALSFAIISKIFLRILLIWEVEA